MSYADTEALEIDWNHACRTTSSIGKNRTKITEKNLDFDFFDF